MARNGTPSGADLKYTIITGAITSTIGVVLGMAINAWWEGYKIRTQGIHTIGGYPT